MTQDDIILGVRAAREEYARSHGFDVRAMVADLRSRDLAGDWPVVSRVVRRGQPSPPPDQPPQQAGAAGPVIPAPESPNAAPAAER